VIILFCYTVEKLSTPLFRFQRAQVAAVYHPATSPKTPYSSNAEWIYAATQQTSAMVAEQAVQTVVPDSSAVDIAMPVLKSGSIPLRFKSSADRQTYLTTH